MTTDQNVKTSPAELLNARPLKSLEPVEIAVALVAAAESHGTVERNMMRTAVLWATAAHAGQRRAARGTHEWTSYVEHPMRCSLRLHRAGVDDVEVLIAAVLHDVVEDGAVKIASFGDNGFDGPARPEGVAEKQAVRDLAADSLAEAFGGRVAETVLAVSNPVADDAWLRGADEPTRRDAYVAHLDEQLSDEAAVLVKVSDFLDNAGSLHHTPMLKKIDVKARKYLAACPLLEQRLAEHVADEQVRQTLGLAVAKTRGRLEVLAAGEHL